LPPQEMERRITNVTERAATTTVTGIEHIESLSLVGVSVVKLYLHQDANAQESLAEFAAICQTILKQLPPGALHLWSPHSVPLTFQSCSCASALRPCPKPSSSILPTISSAPNLPPCKVRLYPGHIGGAAPANNGRHRSAKAHSQGYLGSDVANAINSQNIILPAGTAKLGSTEYTVQLNSSPDTVEQLNDLPVKAIR